MPEYLRVKDKQTKHEKSIPASKFDADLWTRLDKPATNSAGEPLPDKPHTTVSTEAGKKKTGQKAAPEKENS